ncbi:hypothetical protein RJ639_008177 [Escallonia herrerae]|uniref:Uncharacterized protein n=1 Tax=Escallonia herrerae TaxID=1293975 RepID=A0AA88VT46_9ASTE|nr:hypothetical protein RJ639_008177 [Escallonia herrerae]
MVALSLVYKSYRRWRSSIFLLQLVCDTLLIQGSFTQKFVNYSFPDMDSLNAYALKKGKKPCMLGAEELAIGWGSDANFWTWAARTDSRFYSKVAHLVRVNHLEIQGKLRTNKLFANTTYAVFLVFKLATRYSGLESATATVKDGQVYEASCTVYLTFGRERGNKNQEVPRIRDDSWMEVRMGEFNTGEGYNREVVARLTQHSDFEKSGLIVLGIEFHPLD